MGVEVEVEGPDFPSAHGLHRRARRAANDSEDSFADRGPSLQVGVDKNGKAVIRIGHIGAVGALPNEDKVGRGPR